MNILVFGKDGQLGKALHEQLGKACFQKDNRIHFVGRAECDLTDRAQIENLLSNFSPKLIINAAAYTDVDGAEMESEIAFAINASAPQILAKYAVSNGATLLHFSTDYVFDGSKNEAYTELDKTNPLNIYGKSKDAGEQAIIKAFDDASNINGRYVILRTSWVYGDGRNFIRTIMRLAGERPSLSVIHDQYGVPTSADWLAEVACYLVLTDGGIRNFRSGVYHATPKGGTNWHSLACLVIQSALDINQKILLSPAEIIPISSKEYPLPAPRPMNSRLSTVKLHHELERLGLVSKLPHWNTPWDKQVSEYVKHLTEA